jgi:hypothetical protein
MSKRAKTITLILTSITRCLQQQQDLVIVEMLQGIDVVDNVWIEVALAGETW